MTPREPQPPRTGEDRPELDLPAVDDEELDLDAVRVRRDAGAEPLAARWIRVAESDLTHVGIGTGAVRELDVRDSVLRTCDLSNVRAQRCSIRRVELLQSRLVGFAASESDLQDVRATGGTMMLASIEQCRLQRVVFDGVNLRDASFAGSTLHDVAFLGCDLAGADFRGARLRDCRIGGGTLDGVVGVESLRGVAMPWPDLVASAGALAAALGIDVAED